MADKEIGGLTAASSPDGTELIHVVQGGNSRKETLSNVVALVKNGLEFIASTDLSNDGTAEFTAFDATKYDAYMFVFQNVIPATDSVAFYLRTSTDGGTSFASGATDYKYILRRARTESGAIATEASDSASVIPIANANVGSAANEDGVSGHLLIYGPHLAKTTQTQSDVTYTMDSGWLRRVEVAGMRASSADVDAVQFYFSSGNLESGTITMLGIRNS